MITSYFRKLYGNAVVLSNMRGQQQIPYLPQEKLHELRDARLRGTVMYAAHTVPYYRNLFRETKIDPSEIKTISDLERLPLLDKDTVRKDSRQFISTSRKGRTSYPFITSGTTGKPLEIHHDLNSLLANIAFGERERKVMTDLLQTPQYKELYVTYSTSTRRKVWDVYKEWTFIPTRPRRVTLSILEPLDRVVEELNRFQPDALLGYGTYMEILFKALNARGTKCHLPKVVVYAADGMTDMGRRLIEEKFRIPVLSVYNCVEVFKLGFHCEMRKGFHVHEDLCHVKIVNANGGKAKNGEKGEVVISNLINRGTVLLNYRLGDLAASSESECLCGRTLPLLSELEGRLEDTIWLPSGDFVHPRTVWNIFKGNNEVLQYQLIQHEPERFELKLVTVDPQAYQQIIDKILSKLRELLGGSTKIESEYYQELPRERGGKFRPVISHCKPVENA